MKDIDEIDLILAQLQGYMVNVPATIKAKEALYTAIVSGLPKSYGLHVVAEMEDLKTKVGELHPLSKEYQEIKHDKVMEMGRKVGYNEAIKNMTANLNKLFNKDRNEE